MTVSAAGDYRPEFNLLKDAYLGNADAFNKKLEYLAQTAQPERWSFPDTSSNPRPNYILYNYLNYTYDRVKQEGKIAVTEDGSAMCFNTGLQTVNGNDIYAYFIKNRNDAQQPWFLLAFKQRTEPEMSHFAELPDIADYFTNPADFIFDKNMPIYLDYDHIIDDNYSRFLDIGLMDNKHIIRALLETAVSQVTEKLKRNYKIAIPQFYTEKGTGVAKIQLLLPLFLKSADAADLALVIDKGPYSYIGKTILTLEWAYMNSRRIVKPDVDWLGMQ